MKLLMDYSCSW